MPGTRRALKQLKVLPSRSLNVEICMLRRIAKIFVVSCALKQNSKQKNTFYLKMKFFSADAIYSIARIIRKHLVSRWI